MVRRGSLWDRASTHFYAGNSSSDIFYARKCFNPFSTITGAATPAYLPAGGYAVIGPREVTAIGSYKPGAAPGGVQQWGFASPQCINLNISTASPGVKDAAGAADYPAVYDPTATSSPADILPPVGIVAAAVPPTAPTLNPWISSANTAKLGTNVTGTGIGLNVSEPLPQSGLYYDEPTSPNGNSEKAGYSKTDAYDNLTVATSNAFQKAGFRKGLAAPNPLTCSVRTQPRTSIIGPCICNGWPIRLHRIIRRRIRT